jgi:SAM-dependent methyltransferase
MKYQLISLIRSLGLLKAADTVKYWIHRLLLAPRNAAFRRRNPDFRVPPHDLAFDAYNHVDWHAYRDSGLRHAGVFAGIIRRHCPGNALDILEWGCGPGRLIRHLPQLLDGRALRLVGSDYNRRTIDWCRANLPRIDFLHNELMPPLPLPDARFDVVYNFSVFTHLSEEAQKAWTAELKRVLKPGGLLICTTHGENYRYLLTRKGEQAAYEAGDTVVQGRYREGKKWYFAIHPPRFVREELLKDFGQVRPVTVGADAGLLQDVWIGVKG